MVIFETKLLILDNSFYLEDDQKYNYTIFFKHFVETGNIDVGIQLTRSFCSSALITVGYFCDFKIIQEIRLSRMKF